MANNENRETQNNTPPAWFTDLNLEVFKVINSGHGEIRALDRIGERLQKWFAKYNDLANKNCLFQYHYPLHFNNLSNNPIEELKEELGRIQVLIRNFKPDITIKIDEVEINKIQSELALKGVKYFAAKLKGNPIPNNVEMTYPKSKENARARGLRIEEGFENNKIGYLNGLRRNAEACGLDQNQIFESLYPHEDFPNQFQDNDEGFYDYLKNRFIQESKERFSNLINSMCSELVDSDLEADSRRKILDRIKSFFNRENISSDLSYDSQYLKQIRLLYPEFPKLETLTDITYSQEIYEMLANQNNLSGLSSVMGDFEKGKSNFYADILIPEVNKLRHLLVLIQNLKFLPGDVKVYLNKLTSYDLNDLIIISEDDEDENKTLLIKNDFIAKVEQIAQILREKF